MLHVMLIGVLFWHAVTAHPVNNQEGKSHRLSSAAPSVQPGAKQGSSFDQERLIALFGSEAQPVYGNRDPNTGKIVFDSAPVASSRASARPVPFTRRPAEKTEDEETSEEADGIDRKDTRVPETNEINPFQLLPPQFHDLLNIPIHDYGNGTTFNPYDKFKAQPKQKIPLVSSGYANTKVQGSPVPSKPPKYRPQDESIDYDYESDYARPTKPTKRPRTTAPVTRFTTTTTTTESPDDDGDKWANKKRVRPTSQPTFDYYDRPSATRRPTGVTKDNNKFYASRPEPVNREPANRPGSYETEPFRTTEEEFRPVQKPVNRPITSDEPRPVYTARPESTFFDDTEGEPCNDPPPVYVRSPIHVPYQDAYRPGFQDGDQVAEIRVTPKPFFAADDNFNGFKQETEHDPLDIIYDYDDERNQGQGVLFMFDKEPSVSGQPSTTPRPPPVTSSPIPSTYPTVALREKPQPASPAFRPSAPITPIRPDPVDSTFPSRRPEAQFQPPQRLPSDLNPPPARPAYQQPAQHPLPPPPQTGFVAPRPPFRVEQPKDKQPPPNILPLFRPNTQPTNEFQFIKHPAQITEFQRPNSPQIRNEEFRPRPPGGMSPLPSALQTPFSSISQAVANFFGRRSGQSYGSSRSGNLDASLKMDRSGMAAEEDDLLMEESQPAPAIEEKLDDEEEIEDQIAIESSPAVAQQVVVAPPEPALANPPPLGFKVSPEDASPPAFYVYTEKELEEGKPPYLVVGPVMSGPPKVEGAKLVHTAPVQSLPLPAEGAQRRSDVPTDFRVRPFNPNALPTQPLAPPPVQPQAAPARKPFFPISGPGGPIIKLSSRPVQSGFKPPPSAGTQGFVFPQNVPEELGVIPQGIAPVSPGLPPPRVPLNPQKDIASTFSNPTLLHSRPIETPNPPLSALHQLSRPLNSPPTGQGSNQQPLLETASNVTPKPPKRKRPTKAPVAATTTPALPAFNPQQTVTYSTIQQEDGKKIAVVHPAYIVTFKHKPGPPELIDLDAPFVPSVESSPQNTGVSLEKWSVMPTTTEQPTEATQASKIAETIEKKPTPAKEGFNLESGFVPFVPDEK